MDGIVLYSQEMTNLGVRLYICVVKDTNYIAQFVTVEDAAQIHQVEVPQINGVEQQLLCT